MHEWGNDVLRGGTNENNFQRLGGGGNEKFHIWHVTSPSVDNKFWSNSHVWVLCRNSWCVFFFQDSESKEALDYNAVVITSTPEILDKSGLDPETRVNSGLNPETIVDSGLAKGNIKSEEPARYVLGHRKAFSLPRTLGNQIKEIKLS